MKYKLLEGDCLLRLTELESNSIDLIMTSPPYAQQRKQYEGIHPDKYTEWFLPRANEMLRVLKPTGSFILNIKEHAENGEIHPYTYELVLALRKSWRLVDEIVWHKTCIFPVPNSKRLDNTWERLYHFTKSKDHAYYKDAVKVPSRDKNINRADKGEIYKTKAGFILESSNTSRPKLVYPRNVLPIATGKNPTDHPAVFPEKLPAFFIKLCTQSGDTVLDPFAGSGTTMIAAYKADRKAIGIENSEEYCNIIHNRFKQLPTRLQWKSR